MPGSEPVTVTANSLGSRERSDTSQVLRCALADVYLICILIASGLLRGAEGLAISLKRPALCSPPFKQRRVIHKLQQRRSNFFRFRHSYMHRIKASFLECTSRIGYVSQPTDMSIAHTKPHLADIQDISAAGLRGSSEGCNAAQIGFRAILSVEEAQAARIVLKLIVSNYCHASRI
jgi:hypothetical protein